MRDVLTPSELMEMKREQLLRLPRVGSVKIELKKVKTTYVAQIKLWGRNSYLVAKKRAGSAQSSISKAYDAIISQWEKQLKRRSRKSNKKPSLFEAHILPS